MENGVQESRDRFDRWSSKYDTDRISSWFKYIHSLMIGDLNLENKDRILDVGCGTGNAVMMLAEKAGHSKIYGIDISPKMIETASKKTGNGRISFLVADSRSIPFGDSYFDLVLSSNSFHHYPNPLVALKEIHRVLKPGGEFLLADACRDIYFPIRIQNTYRRIFEKGHINYYTTSEIKKMLEETGFSRISLIRKVRGMGIKKKLFTGVGIFLSGK
ncbi:MAG: methyltransferase domain-containing protein [Actinobacteria bacterium]|nr:methyltransferase domain-containing protein [Actinomycetota bacterium]